jgi:hypothetical protein
MTVSVVRGNLGDQGRSGRVAGETRFILAGCGAVGRGNLEKFISKLVLNMLLSYLRKSLPNEL